MLHWNFEITNERFKKSKTKILLVLDTYQSVSIIPMYITYIFDKIFNIPSSIGFFNVRFDEDDDKFINYQKVCLEFFDKYNIDKYGFYCIKNDKIINFKSSLTLAEVNDFILTIQTFDKN